MQAEWAPFIAFVQFAKIRVKHESNCFLGSLSAKFDRFERFVLKIIGCYIEGIRNFLFHKYNY